MLSALSLVIGYLLGSIPSGLWIGKIFYKINLRDIGSGNTGTTNAFRAFGPKGGIAVFLVDMLKGAFAVWIGIWLGAEIHPLLPGVAAMLGHTYSLYDGFRGGKAVATAFGVVFAYNWVFSLMAIAVFFIVLYFSRMVSLSSITAVAATVVISFFINDPALTFLAIGALIFIIWRHRTNIQRIRQGTESKVPFGFGYKKEK